jgi:hypothetical protein
MKNRKTLLKILFSVLACALLCFSTVACDCKGCKGCNDTGAVYIEFGSYAKTIKSADVTLSAEADANGYYTGSDGASYVKVVASSEYNGFKFSDGTTVTAGEEYYFKLEPIVWQIVEDVDGKQLLVTKEIIDARIFDAENNNYKNSDLRAWLNGEFLQKAFTTEELAKINDYTVTNGVASTNTTMDQNSFVTDDTVDKVFVLSYNEAINSKFIANADRDKIATDYAIAKGTVVNAKSEGNWWLRSPSNMIADEASMVNYDGLSEYRQVGTVNGIVVAIEITAE